MRTGTHFVSDPNFTALKVLPSMHRFGQQRQASLLPYTVPFFLFPLKHQRLSHGTSDASVRVPDKATLHRLLLQEQFDALHQKSKNGEYFANLMPLILAQENILHSYRNIKQTLAGTRQEPTD